MTTPPVTNGELDAWLDVHLFGSQLWEELRGRPGSERLVAYWVRDGREPWKDTRTEYQQPERYRRIEFSDLDPRKHELVQGSRRHYSSTYEGMGACLEAMKGRGWAIDLTWTNPDPLSPYEMERAAEGWLATFTKKGVRPHPLWFSATAPLAVALAARAAIEGEK